MMFGTSSLAKDGLIKIFDEASMVDVGGVDS